MATKTIINCMEHTVSQPHQGISIIIDQQQQADNLKAQPELSGTSTNSIATNIIKIQHTSSRGDPSTNHHILLTTLSTSQPTSNSYTTTSTSSFTTSSSPSSSSSLASVSSATTLNNKTLIDINRNNEHNGVLAAADQSNEHVLQINCSTTSNEISREIKENSKHIRKLECNGFTTDTGTAGNAEEEDGKENGDHNEVGAKEKLPLLLDLKEIANVKKEKEFTKVNNGYYHSPQEVAEAAATAEEDEGEGEAKDDDEEESGQTTSQQQQKLQLQQKQQQVNNGNSKYRENGHFIKNCSTITATKHEHNHHHHHNDIKHNNDNDDHHHFNNIHNNNEVTSSSSSSSIGGVLGDHDHINDDDDISRNGAALVLLAKRVEVDFSHGKRSFNEENSNSLITKADASTTYTTLTINQQQNLTNHSNQENLENSKENPNHVVKIQIKPKDIKTEKQISVVKIENPIENHSENIADEIVNVLKKQQDKEELKKIEKEKSENIENLENFLEKDIKQESVINALNEKMVQKPSNTNHQTSSSSSVTVSNNNHASSTTGNVVTQSNTGSTTVTELNVSNPNYLYYMMSSGQFSPCDTLDSGTGSDLESNGQPQQQSSPNLLMKKSSNLTSIAPLEMHIKTTKIRVSTSTKSKDLQQQQQQQQRQCSFTDSEESEASSLSCDSLHSNEFLRQQSISPIESSKSTKKIQSFLPDSLLREIKNLKFSSTDYEAENEEDDDILPPQMMKSVVTKSLNNYASENNNYETISTQQYVNSQSEYVQARNNLNSSSSPSSSSLKRASLPSKTFVLNTEDGTFIDTKMNSMPRKYEADKYYNFHVNEHDNFRSFGNNSSLSLSSPNGDGDSYSITDFDTKSLHDDVFAGYKDIRCGSNTSTIRSSKGTVRGVKNRVRNGIATFLQMQQPNIKNYKEKDSGKVVLYTTSMGIIRDTYAKCANVKQILRTLLVKFEERDVFMSVEYQQEIKERMHSEIIKVPQLYVEGQHIGDADTVERLNESGELRQLLKPYKSISTTYTCQTCGGYRLLPCPSCNGSKKSVHRNHFTAEFVALKCMNCDEVGLVKCHNC